MVNPTRDRIVKIRWVVNIMAAVLSYCISFVDYLFFAELEAED
jgi:preprotein translocase subunit SecE